MRIPVSRVPAETGSLTGGLFGQGITSGIAQTAQSRRECHLWEWTDAGARTPIPPRKQGVDLHPARRGGWEEPPTKYRGALESAISEGTESY